MFNKITFLLTFSLKHTQVADHKTLTSHGEGFLVLDGIEVRWLERYISNVCPSSTCNFLFLNLVGKQMKKVSRAVTTHFQTLTGIPKTITTTNTAVSEIFTTFICLNWVIYNIG